MVEQRDPIEKRSAKVLEGVTKVPEDFKRLAAEARSLAFEPVCAGKYEAESLRMNGWK